jgi:secondary thiamine-phosphate synthase enzyme
MKNRYADRFFYKKQIRNRITIHKNPFTTQGVGVHLLKDNADAHMKRQIMGREAVVAVTNGALDFGTWEQIFYGEFDGRRKKRVLVKIIGE